jgi:hypothetical protein
MTYGDRVVYIRHGRRVEPPSDSENLYNEACCDFLYAAFNRLSTTKLQELAAVMEKRREDFMGQRPLGCIAGDPKVEGGTR